ncbi:AbrB/MazE/SpoVT family DNA-binding domain-containing protein [Candidatus Woesearchaeota archaeon]|nr:AbrB/MazE/SpoVT family DNA-binding domain-containing protein [Candidatus Woesearchaeota archaeon]
MKSCTKCASECQEKEAKTPEGVAYTFYKCKACGEGIVDMTQLHAVAEKYREMKKYHAKVTKWGMSLGVRIPKEIAKRYKFRDNKEVTIIPEEKGIRIIPV